MRPIVFLVVVVLLLIIGGGLTSQIAANNNNTTAVLPFLLQQTDNPDASVFEAPPWQAEQFFILVGFILFNLIGMAVTIMVVMWFLNRGAVRSKAAASQEPVSSTAAESS